ncbi:hypothetical protein HPB52_012065 [Rhipicephalus sanguineus]|uniref:Uncharacterized protein n=1 Tax=Rhipicephalus sanguineus TaxID=34632 RepID=A0A9D4Q6L7_RHISA|nr:hypothetical protein HPB52_012065 [Rhipicephalus sanguineus]
MEVRYCPRCPFLSSQFIKVINQIGMVHSAEPNFRPYWKAPAAVCNTVPTEARAMQIDRIEWATNLFTRKRALSPWIQKALARETKNQLMILPIQERQSERPTFRLDKKRARDKYAKEAFPFVAQEELVMGQGAKYHYVPLPKLLHVLCSIPDIAAHLKTPEPKNKAPSVYRDYTDGMLYESTFAL